jgi:molybdopterin/thiamine biosynthesis adenylyltransferase
MHETDRWSFLEGSLMSADAEEGLVSAASAEDRYAWQQEVTGFGPAGQARLRAATVLVSRIGGVGGTAAAYLAAAGVGRLLLAHGGSLRLDDLNRQILMNTPGVGSLRVDVADETLRGLNPDVMIETIPANITAENASELVARCDLVVSAAPLFAERLALNQAAVRWKKPLVDAAMYDLEARLFVRETQDDPCLACLYPAEPVAWRRRFPVLGAVAGVIGSLAALAAIQVLAGMPRPTAGRLLHFDLDAFAGRQITIPKRADCPVCGR